MRPDGYIELASDQPARAGRKWRVLVSLIVAIGVTIAATSIGHAAPAPLAQALTADGAARLAAGSGAAILGGQGMLPGQSVSGTVTVANVGDASGQFELSASALIDRPGPRGGRLGDRLHVTVLDLRARRNVYDGSIAGLSHAALGIFVPHATRKYRITVTFPRGPADNAYQSASATITFNWMTR